MQFQYQNRTNRKITTTIKMVNSIVAVHRLETLEAYRSLEVTLVLVQFIRSVKNMTRVNEREVSKCYWIKKQTQTCQIAFPWTQLKLVLWKCWFDLPDKNRSPKHQQNRFTLTLPSTHHFGFTCSYGDRYNNVPKTKGYMFN